MQASIRINSYCKIRCVCVSLCVPLRWVWCSWRGTGLSCPSAGPSTTPRQSTLGQWWYRQRWIPARLSPQRGNCTELWPSVWRRLCAGHRGGYTSWDTDRHTSVIDLYRLIQTVNPSTNIYKVVNTHTVTHNNTQNVHKIIQMDSRHTVIQKQRHTPYCWVLVVVQV